MEILEGAILYSSAVVLLAPRFNNCVLTEKISAHCDVTECSDTSASTEICLLLAPTTDIVLFCVLLNLWKAQQEFY